MKNGWFVFLFLLLVSSLSFGACTDTGHTGYCYVGTGQTYSGASAISTCMLASAAGQTCLVKDSGNYNGWTQTPTHSGTIGNLITVTPDVGQTPTITSQVIVQANYIGIVGMNFNGTFTSNYAFRYGNTGPINGLKFESNTITSTDSLHGQVITVYGAPTVCIDCSIRNNTITRPVGDTNTAASWGLNLQRSIFEGNVVNGGSGDFSNVTGDHSVFRNNTWSGANRNGQTVHLDMFQWVSQGAIPATFNLFEGNTASSCTDPVDASCHFTLAQTSGSVTAFSGTSGTLTFSVTNNFIAGQQILLGGFTLGNVGLNGQVVTVLSSGLSTTQFQANVTGSGYSSASGFAGYLADGNIYRFNTVLPGTGFNGSGFGMGGEPGDWEQNTWIYNNTLAGITNKLGNLWAQSSTFSFVWNSSKVKATELNNLCYNCAVGSSSYSPLNTQGGATLTENGNQIFTSGYALGWASPYSTESTYGTLHSVDPLLTSYPTSVALGNGSPSISAGVALTTVAAGGCTGAGNTTIALTDVHPFQDGWGSSSSPVHPDTIRVGASTTAQIAQGGITYDASPAVSGTALLTSHITCSAGDPVYLYANSSQSVVLANALPDIGSVPSGGVAPFNVTLSLTGSGSGTVKEPSATGAKLNCSWNGTVQTGTCSATYADTSTLDVGQTASAGTFTGWSGACSGTGSCGPTISGADINIGASFALTPTISLALDTQSCNAVGVCNPTGTVVAANLNGTGGGWACRDVTGGTITDTSSGLPVSCIYSATPNGDFCNGTPSGTFNFHAHVSDFTIPYQTATCSTTTGQSDGPYFVYFTGREALGGSWLQF